MKKTLALKCNRWNTAVMGGMLCCSLLFSTAPPAEAQTWNAATSTEVAYPSLFGPPPSTFNLDNNVAHISNYAYNSNRFGQYVEIAGWSRSYGAGGGGGFSYGLASSGTPYAGQGVEVIPNAVDVRVGYLESDGAYIVVAYFDIATMSYYCRLYPWLAPNVLGAPITYFLYSGTIDYRCNMDISYNASKVAITWCTNNALFTAVGMLAGGGLQFSPGLPPTSPAIMISVPFAGSHAAADVAFRFDPFSGTEVLHYAFFVNNFPVSFIREIEIPFMTLFTSTLSGYTYAGPVDNNPVVAATGTGLVIPRLDCPDVGPNRWAYTYTENDRDIMVRLGAGGPNINLTGGGLVTPINAYKNVNPCLAYDQMGNNFFVSWGTTATSSSFASTQSYVAMELNNGGALVSAPDYLLVPANPNTEASPVPLVALSRHANTMGDLYTSFCEYPNPDVILEHKNHPWASSTAWRGKGIATAQQAAEGISVYPNPFRNSFRIESKDNGQTKVSVSDLFGRQLGSYQGDLESVNAQLNQLGNTLASGTYLLSVVQGKPAGQVFKVVKQ